MYDNGLIKYYSQNNYKDGILDARDINLVEQQKVSFKVTSCASSEGRFFKRVNGSRVKDKKITDAQILLSQIYNKAGLQSAVYLPAQIKGKRFLLSNDVSSSPDTILAYDYIAQFPHFQSRFPLDFLSERHSGKVVERYFTERALQQQTKMRVFDTASYNNDRHYANFFYRLQDGVADDVRAIDFELGTCAYNRTDAASDAFYNDFMPLQMPRQELLTKFKEDELFATLVDKDALAEEVGSINPVAIAQDVEDTIGYKIDPALPQFLDKSFTEMAEVLSQ